MSYYIPVCVGGWVLRYAPLFIPSSALLLPFHRSSLPSHHTSFLYGRNFYFRSTDRPMLWWNIRIFIHKKTRRSTDRSTECIFSHWLVDQIRRRPTDRPTDRPTVGLVVRWSGGRSVGRSVGASVRQDHKLFMVSIDSGERRPTNRPTEIGIEGGRRERSKKKTVDRRSVGVSVRPSERMNTHSLGMCGSNSALLWSSYYC